LLTPLAAAGVVGTMGVALAANHFKNGFFIFRKGEGYEYVLTLLVAALALAALGGGEWSLDRTLNIDDNLQGWAGLAIAAGAGLVAARCSPCCSSGGRCPHRAA